MLNPFLNLHEPVQHYADHNEEELAQVYGRSVRNPEHPNRMALRLGRFFLKVGERLTHEDPCMERIHHDHQMGFSEETA